MQIILERCLNSTQGHVSGQFELIWSEVWLPHSLISVANTVSQTLNLQHQSLQTFTILQVQGLIKDDPCACQYETLQWRHNRPFAHWLQQTLLGTPDNDTEDKLLWLPGVDWNVCTRSFIKALLWFFRLCGSHRLSLADVEDDSSFYSCVG